MLTSLGLHSFQIMNLLCATLFKELGRLQEMEAKPPSSCSYITVSTDSCCPGFLLAGDIKAPCNIGRCLVQDSCLWMADSDVTARASVFIFSLYCLSDILEITVYLWIGIIKTKEKLKIFQNLENWVYYISKRYYVKWWLKIKKNF